MPKRSRKQPASPIARVEETSGMVRRAASAPGGRAPRALERALNEVDDGAPPDGEDPLAVAFGSRGGLEGGRARAENLTPVQRRKSALKAAQARWGQRSGKTK